MKIHIAEPSRGCNWILATRLLPCCGFRLTYSAGLQGLQYNRPTCSLTLHSPTNQLCQGLQKCSVTSIQRKRNLLNYACDITSNLTGTQNEKDDRIVVLHPGSNNPWKCVTYSDIYLTNSIYTLLPSRNIRLLCIKSDKLVTNVTGFISDNSCPVGVHKRYCAGTPPEEHNRLYKCQHWKFSTNFKTGLSAHIPRTHPSLHNDQLKEKTRNFQ